MSWGVPTKVRPAPIAILTLFALVLSGCETSAKPAAGPSAASPPASIESLTAKAKTEKGIVMYGNVPASLFQPIVDGFKAAYGINLEYTSLDDNSVFSKYQSERAQGARTADVLLASAPALWIQAEDNGVVAKFTPQGLSHFPSYTTQAPGLYVMSPDPVLTAYNTKLLSGSAIPTSYDNLATLAKADPAKYPMVTYPVDNQFGYSAIYGLIHILGWDKFWSIVDQLAPASKTYSEGLTQLTQVVTGAASVGWIGSGLGQVVIPAAGKGLAGYRFMQDATPLVPRGIAVTTGAVSPASAQLFLDYIFSDPGQQLLCKAGFEAGEENFTPSNGCIAYLGNLLKTVPQSTVYLVPIAEDVLTQQPKITQRWNQAFHR